MRHLGVESSFPSRLARLPIGRRRAAPAPAPCRPEALRRLLRLVPLALLFLAAHLLFDARPYRLLFLFARSGVPIELIVVVVHSPLELFHAGAQTAHHFGNLVPAKKQKHEYHYHYNNGRICKICQNHRSSSYVPPEFRGICAAAPLRSAGPPYATDRLGRYTLYCCCAPDFSRGTACSGLDITP